MVGLVARLVLAAILLAASVDKLFEPVTFAQAISNYHLAPDWAVPLAALTLPWLELVVGGCLLIGFLTDSAALLAAVLGLVFAGAMGSALARGLNIECGCFNDGARVSWAGLALDLALVALALLILRYGPGRGALFAAGEPTAEQ